MCTVDKLLIKGIRSFSPDNENAITFNRPLTLIVGPNGSGKTTIVECLKTSATGILPPNCRNGQSFIHDPKVSGDIETKGQIKLRFKTPAGKEVVCIRNFQLSQKGSKLQYKGLENTLQTINEHTGQKAALSYRCADIDREVPQLMGVTPPILENVIFVHQDDANWPLAEPAALKKRFDDIFSATRYTQALVTMRKLHKDRLNEIKVHKLKLENLQTVKDSAVKLEQSVEMDKKKAADLNLQIQALEQSLAATQSRIDSLEAVLEELRQLQKEIDFKEGVRTSLLRQKTEAYNALEEENEDSDEELAEWKAKFHERIVKLDRDVLDLQRAMNDAATKSDKLSEMITRSSEEMGKLQGEEEAHRGDRINCQELLRGIFRTYRLGTPSEQLDDRGLEQCVRKLEKRLEELNYDYEQLKVFNNGELTKSLKKMEEISERHSAASGQVKGNTSQKATCESRLSQITQQLRSYMFVDEEMSDVQERITSMEEDLEKLLKKQEEKNFDVLISQAKAEKQMLAEKITPLEQERASLDRQSNDRLNLKARKQDLASKQRDLKKIMEESKDKLRIVSVAPNNPETIKTEVERAYSKSKEAYEQLVQKSRDADMVEARTRAMLQDTQSTLAKQRGERDAKKRLLENKLAGFITTGIEVDAYTTHLSEAVTLKTSRKSQHDMADGMFRTFGPFEQIARATHACPCCERGFSAPEEEEFINKQRTKRSTIEGRLQDLALQSAEAEARARNLEALRPTFEEYQKLVAEAIPKTESLLQELTDEHAKCAETQFDVSCLVAQAKSEVEVIEQLRFTAQTIDDLCGAIAKQNEAVEQLETELNARSSSVRTAQDVGEEIKALGEKMTEIDRKLEKLKDEQDYFKDDINNAKVRKYSEDLKLRDIKTKLERRNTLLEEQERLSQDLIQIESKIQMASEQLEPLSREKDKQLQEYNALKRQTDEQLQTRSNNVRKFEKEYEAAQTLWYRIKSYMDANKPQQLENAKRKLSELQAQKEEEERKRATFTTEVERVKSLLTQQKVVERNIIDNINYRKLCADEQKCMQEVQALEQRMFAIGSHTNFEEDLKNVMREKQKVFAEVSHCKGTIGVYESNIAKNRGELRLAQYKDIKERYREQLVDLKTNEMATKDLLKYHDALEKALMRFHTMKMEEINKIIKELWQQTYQGKDIDYIQIIADDEGKGKRSYSYRVVMRSGGVDLEMRGRCSAGQKVLAALIIRLALAETFCLNCGILALDEPTSHLDVDNSRAFAAALLRIIEERREQENFQLIVITHDMDFARLVAQGQTENYYRVSKDDMQNSLIELQDFHNVG